MVDNKSPSSSGKAVDALGGPAIDPTANVIALIETANRRQDDLRELNNRYLDARLTALERALEKNEKCARESEELRSQHSKEVRDIETKRLDAVRQVDVLAVTTTSAQSTQAIQTLAASTLASAEQLRTMVATTATTLATQLANTVTMITERLGALEKSSYEGKGKQAYADPMMADLVAKMESLVSSRAMGAGKSEGISGSWAILLGALSLIVMMITIGTAMFMATRSSAPSQPQMIYVPAAPGTLLPSTQPSTVPR